MYITENSTWQDKIFARRNKHPLTALGVQVRSADLPIWRLGEVWRPLRRRASTHPRRPDSYCTRHWRHRLFLRGQNSTWPRKTKRCIHQLDRAWACWAVYSVLYEAHMESDQMQHGRFSFPITDQPRATDFTSVIAAAGRCSPGREYPTAVLVPPPLASGRTPTSLWWWTRTCRC